MLELGQYEHGRVENRAPVLKNTQYEHRRPKNSGIVLKPGQMSTGNTQISSFSNYCTILDIFLIIDKCLALVVNDPKVLII